MLCPSCGQEASDSGNFCLHCGAPLPKAPAPAKVPVRAPPFPQDSVYRPPKDRGVALVLEILPGLFGLPGIGWIYGGRTGAGVALLLCTLVWDLIAILIDIASGGFACLITVPVNLAVVAISVALLSSYTRQHPELFGR